MLCEISQTQNKLNKKPEVGSHVMDLPLGKGMGDTHTFLLPCPWPGRTVLDCRWACLESDEKEHFKSAVRPRLAGLPLGATIIAMVFIMSLGEQDWLRVEAEL